MTRFHIQFCIKDILILFFFVAVSLSFFIDAYREHLFPHDFSLFVAVGFLISSVGFFSTWIFKKRYIWGLIIFIIILWGIIISLWPHILWDGRYSQEIYIISKTKKDIKDIKYILYTKENLNELKVQLSDIQTPYEKVFFDGEKFVVDIVVSGESDIFQIDFIRHSFQYIGIKIMYDQDKVIYFVEKLPGKKGQTISLTIP